MNMLPIGKRLKDCSQGFCSFYCPQLCYIIFPPPPPPPPEDFPDDGPNFSPLVITVIGFLAGALLLLSYYAILSHYFRSRSLSTTTRRDEQTSREADVETELWFVATNGVDEAVVRSMATFKYRRREGLVEGTECSVCLSEFVEDERLKLLPKCSHAFHVACIDTWLKCHSNCPLCRANVAAPASPTPPRIPLESSSAGGDFELGIGDEQVNLDVIKTGGGDGEGDRRVRRSVSMDSVFEPRLSIADPNKEESCRGGTSTSGGDVECGMRTGEMKRSLSSGKICVLR